MLKVFLTKGEVSQNGVTAADGLAAFNNANSLIVFVPDPETGGMYMTVFSAQIAGSFGPDGVFNPNNLGYDLEGVYVRGNNNGFLTATAGTASRTSASARRSSISTTAAWSTPRRCSPAPSRKQVQSKAQPPAPRAASLCANDGAKARRGEARRGL